jgi:hypothetical protein
MIVVVAGRRIDPPNAAATRFPLKSRGAVAKRIQKALSELGATTLVSSAACGSDLLAINAARALGARRRIVLPYQEDWFLEDSVTDRPGRWEDLYAQVIGEARASDDLLILGERRGSDDAYRAANEAILAEALRLAREENPDDPGAALAGLIIWEGASRGPDDVTDHMRQRLANAGAKIVTVLTAPAAATV